MKMSNKKEPLLRKPAWLKISIASTDNYAGTSETIKEAALHTICSSGRCPNQAECWSRGTATFMIGGNECTRSCRFCGTPSCKNPAPLDPDEPRRVAESVRRMGLKYAVITSVDRDDLPDGGAAHWAETVREIRRLSPNTTIEVLIPDFQGDLTALDAVLESKPDVVGHNMETVKRLTPTVRHRATYDTSLKVLKHIADSGFITKTGIMVGLGETPEEVEELLRDCYSVEVSSLTIGQYLRPSKQNIAVEEYVHPDQFRRYKEIGEALGLSHVESGPLVRSSYKADQQFEVAKKSIHLKDL
ncbi:lipoyl synthase [Porphyromonas levii]|uniref:lipoyl synthase n=1 Tax=Porphyromonas levii TaxID=28114 RepID=UPI001B8BB5B5|nr:lipoyl synthase [Porphyromonas levii]MBR8713499.1 Lipoyl synthase [Porphyromonas levii]MBR8715532.1 Lipoyl synthase [Porphyromonas levii]MBR8728058.1 Lipoyl synthase [Porphyromonas levii]MBR8736408.1 Lipoyl synthase [Porphyromonas levii]MBR8778423.1 Lipoyl synthase [Porphyromonas levii]